MTGSNKNQDNNSHKNDASHAASVMGRKDTSHEEKSKAASVLGSKGDHKNTTDKNSNHDTHSKDNGHSKNTNHSNK